MHSVCSFSTRVRILHKSQRIKLLSGHYSNFLHNTEFIKHICCSSRIICTDSRRQGELGYKFKSDDGKEQEPENLCYPVSFLKNSVKIVDNHYLKLISVPNEYRSVEALIQTKEFKNVLARSSFFYDVNLAENTKNPLPFSSVYFYSFEDIYSSSIYHVKSQQLSNSVDEVLSSTRSDVKGNDTGKPTEQQLLHVIDRLTQCLLRFFEKPHDYSIYHKNIIFQNNIKGVTIKGLTAYVQAMYILKIYGYVQYAKVKVEILKITHHIEDGTVRVRWRVKGISRHKILLNFWKLKSMNWNEFIQEEAMWLDGFSVFSVGTDGLIYKHICDKMTPNDDTVASKKADLKSRLLGLFELTPRSPAAGSLNALIPCYRNQEFSTCKKLT